MDYQNQIIAIAECPKCKSEITERDIETGLCEPCFKVQINNTKFNQNEKGIEITNQSKYGVQTGRYFNDHYGTWYQVKWEDREISYMIGEHRE